MRKSGRFYIGKSLHFAVLLAIMLLCALAPVPGLCN